MLAIERREQILELLRQHKRVLVGELSRRYHVSEETIRRDLERLEREGYATKTYGGAVFREESQSESPFSVREKTNVREKADHRRSRRRSAPGRGARHAR